MITLLWIYLGVAVFTFFSFLLRMPWTGAKEDYEILDQEFRVATLLGRPMLVPIILYLLVSIVIALVWPEIYRRRMKDCCWI